MIKIINGKKYNTQTAENLGEYWNGLSVRDFGHCTETLYKKRTGEFFLHGEGGPMTKYKKTIGMNEWSGGEKIIPLTFEEAREWAETHLDAEEYEKIFGEVDESGDVKGVLYSLPVSSIEKVKRIATERRCSASQVITELIASL